VSQGAQMQEGSFFTKVPAGHSLIPNPSLEVHALLEYFESVVKNWLPHPRGGQLAAKFFSAEKKFETHSFGFASLQLKWTFYIDLLCTGGQGCIQQISSKMMDILPRLLGT
jgi:hypothetical protein